jgi:hypothetical protein
MTGACAVTGLRLEPLRTFPCAADGAEVLLAVGTRELAEAVFRTEPPMPHELEQAL